MDTDMSSPNDKFMTCLHQMYNELMCTYRPMQMDMLLDCIRKKIGISIPGRKEKKEESTCGYKSAECWLEVLCNNGNLANTSFASPRHC